MRTFVIWYFLALVVIMTVYILLVMRIMKGRVIRPINLVADAPQFDDLTMLCLRYNGSQDAE